MDRWTIARADKFISNGLHLEQERKWRARVDGDEEESLLSLL